MANISQACNISFSIKVQSSATYISRQIMYELYDILIGLAHVENFDDVISCLGIGFVTSNWKTCYIAKNCFYNFHN